MTERLIALCRTCGAPFPALPSMFFCSHSCKKGSHSMTPALSLQKHCQNCHRLFSTSSPTARYCTISCKEAAYRTRRRRAASSRKVPDIHPPPSLPRDPLDDL